MSILGLTPQLQRERPIFVFSSGHRSGSTLLQRVLNSSPDMLIWGEQDGYLNHIVPVYRNLSKRERKTKGYRKTFLLEGYNTFTANMLPEEYEIKESMTLHLYGLFGIPAARLGRSTWGFKEVRYGANVALFLQECFPNARFIHLIRDVTATYLSMKRWEVSDTAEWEHGWTLNTLQNWDRISQSFLDKGKEIRHLMKVRFEDMTADPALFVDQLASFLEVPQDSFDRDVFNLKLRTAGKKAQNLREPNVNITEEDATLLYTSERLKLLDAYGYTIATDVMGGKMRAQ